ncbi:ParB-like nuclease domain-containing protein [Micromonospora matsumotoense]|uniref:ParB-like nuclease domain-containing protein n=1 Tax=Micromonospora matsumotoense TaxID=121616 RepID=A0A1C5AQZ8_9ACTN|nr:ParB N-terminal domain-containing protein [Micromonospora matsumotoense]SCF47632.1 ParB-like nuclease domain-containing protein [Micromonospora matsumotoense]
MSAFSDQQPASIVEIDIRTLLPADSPRFAIDDGHARALAESAAELPPILVHRATLRVIDGMHRVRATELRNRSTISACWFEGDEHAAFLLAVETNTRHGLPLTSDERRQAALRILRINPQWSDRSIAERTGWNATSVGVLRRETTDPDARPDARVGRDGRVRPSTTADGRRVAAEVIARDPAASLREIARQAGISVGTARDVRFRLAQGRPVVPDGDPAVAAPADDRSGDEAAQDFARSVTLFAGLRNDPSLRFSESGRLVLRRLHTQLRTTEEWKRLAPAIPPHGRSAVAEILAACAEDLKGMAQELRVEANRPAPDAAPPVRPRSVRVDRPRSGSWSVARPA